MVDGLSRVSALGFEDFQPEDLRLLSSADFVCVFNWMYNRKGTVLAEGVFRYCKRNSRTVTFFDPADPWPRRNELPKLIRRALRSDLLDFLAANDNEAKLFARILSNARRMRGRKVTAGQAGRAISEFTTTKVYVHTAHYSALVDHEHFRSRRLSKELYGEVLEPEIHRMLAS